MIVEKPWGHYEDIYRVGDVVFKRLIIKPGQSISYQTHSKRGEFWFVASGRGQLKFSFDVSPKEVYSVITLEPGQTMDIQKSMAHQATCLGDISLVIYEMQYGECEESDITRIDDPYKR